MAMVKKEELEILKRHTFVKERDVVAEVGKQAAEGKRGFKEKWAEIEQQILEGLGDMQ